MEIESIILTPAEVKTAMAMYLASRGLQVSVSSLDTRGYPIKDYIISCIPVEDVQPPAVPMIPEPLNILSHHEVN